MILSVRGAIIAVIVSTGCFVYNAASSERNLAGAKARQDHLQILSVFQGGLPGGKLRGFPWLTISSLFICNLAY